jgi:arylsulfatase A-like enzyme
MAQRKGAPPAQRPNILLVLADDLGAWMTGRYGNAEIRTPNIDRWAKAGTYFLNSFCTTPIGSPSRATLFTGLLPTQHGIEDFLTSNPLTSPPQGQKEPPSTFAKESMLFELLSQNGYKCGYVGKWDMGNDENPGRGISYACTLAGGSPGYSDPEMSLNGQRVKESGYLAELMTKRASDFLDQQQKNAPFFLTVGYLNPHAPYEGHPRKYYDMYAGTNFDSFGIQPVADHASRDKEMMRDPVANLRRCAAAVSALDDQLPVLQRKLLEKGLFDNTIAIFTSVHGLLLGRHGLWSDGHASTPVNLYDEVMGVPMIWSWPGRIPTDSARPEMVSAYDFFPTICEAAGVQPPAGRNLVGRSYLPIVLNQPPDKKASPWPGIAFGQFRNAEMARSNRFKLIERNGGQGPNELFDMRQDSREFKNLYGDPRFVSVQQDLAAALAAWRNKARNA